MAKMSCHSAARRYGSSLIELQKASHEESSRRATLARRHKDEAKEHVTNRCSQSSAECTLSWGVWYHMLVERPRQEASTEQRPGEDSDLPQKASADVSIFLSIYL